jgi:hypothetical protein
VGIGHALHIFAFDGNEGGLGTLVTNIVASVHEIIKISSRPKWLSTDEDEKSAQGAERS